MINKRFLLWFSMAILLVITVGVTAFYSLKKQSAQEVQIAHIYRVLAQTVKVSKLMAEMQTDQATAPDSNSHAYLRNYEGFRNNLTAAADTIEKADFTNPLLVEQLRDRLQQLESYWSAEASSHKQLLLIKDIQHRIDEISAAGEKLLIKDVAQKETDMRHAIWVIVLGTFFILLAVAGLIRLVTREHRSRIKTELILNDKFDELNRVNEDTNKANLLLNGLRLVNDSLMGNDTVTALVHNFLETITGYLQIPCAVCYLFDNDKHKLVHAGAVALAIEMKAGIKLGEGITGAAAMRKDITVIRNVPENYWSIASASGAALPDTLVILPLWKKTELIGVIELGCFGRDMSAAIDLLNDMAANIALGLSSAQLLALTQQQRDAMEVQQEELRQTNEELSIQAEELQSSEEGLRIQEEELTKINLELEEKTESLEVARMEMQKKAEDLELAGRYKSEFLANMSHELRTPLNSILILTALMQDNKDANLTKKQQENLGIVYKSGNDLLKLINDILDLSKIEAGKADFNIEKVEIRSLAEEIQQSFAAVAANKNITFKVNSDVLMQDSLLTDRQRLGQVIKNLLSNAFKFTPQGGEVVLNFRSTEENVKISVSDTGIGIPADKQELIFGAFQQADGATTRRYGGTGLGLSISKEIVSRLGGEIRLQSTEGKGSIFTVIMPVDKSAEGNAIPVEAAIHEQTQIADDRAGLIPSERAVLIIEDDVNFARAVNDFAAQRGFKTMIALSGDEGLHYARKYRPAAIVLDLALPVISGQHILKTLKGDAELKHIPVHVMSAHDGLDLAPQDIAGYVQKPVRQHDLEYTFESIETYISQHYRKALILCDAGSPLKQLVEACSANALPGLVYEIAESKEQALQRVKAGEAECLIIDCSKDIQSEVNLLQTFREAKNGLYVITYVDHDISAADAKQLQAYANAVIGPSAQANSRLLDEVALFLQKVSTADKLPKQDNLRNQFTGSLAGKTILVADDDMRNVYALSALLEAQDMIVLTAEHGKEAIEMLQKHPKTDLVLMDIMMPEMDGYEAMQLIRQEKRYAELPIIALTAKAMLGDREKCIEAGASDYITKPVDNFKLLSLLRVWLAGKE